MLVLVVAAGLLDAAIQGPEKNAFEGPDENEKVDLGNGGNGLGIRWTTVSVWA